MLNYTNPYKYKLIIFVMNILDTCYCGEPVYEGLQIVSGNKHLDGHYCSSQCATKCVKSYFSSKRIAEKGCPEEKAKDIISNVEKKIMSAQSKKLNLAKDVKWS